MYCAKPQNTYNANTIKVISSEDFIVRKCDSTYNPPSAKTNIKLIFCFLGSLRVDKTGIGSVIRIKSVRMFKAAAKNQRNFLLIQVLGIVESQKPEIGLQIKIAVKNPCMPQTAMNTRAAQQA